MRRNEPLNAKEKATDIILSVAYFLFSNTLSKMSVASLAIGPYSKRPIYDLYFFDTQDALNTIKLLFEKGVRINVLNLGIIENTSTGRLIFTIFSAFADFERDLIVERTQEGKELAKQKPDFREGRPKKFNQQQINLAMNLLKNHSYKEVEKMTGISKSTLTRNKRKQRFMV